MCLIEHVYIFMRVCTFTIRLGVLRLFTLAKNEKLVVEGGGGTWLCWLLLLTPGSQQRFCVASLIEKQVWELDECILYALWKMST